MELLEGKVLTRYLLEKYAKNPRGWHFTIAPSMRENFFDALVSNPDETWQLKIDSIFKPSPMLLGAMVEVDASKLAHRGSLPFGYRKLEPDILLKLLGDQDESGHLRNLDSILSPLDTVVPDQGGAYAQGPFIYSNEKIAAITPNQSLLDDRLSSEMKRLLRNKYLSYG